MDNTNDITGFKDPHVDALLKEYDKAFDIADRVRIVREIDGILANSYQYVLFWDAPFIRLAYWNKFGTPPGYVMRTGDYYTAYQMWWIDPAKNAQLDKALRDSSVKLDVGPTEDKYWPNYDKTQQAATASH